MTRIKTPFHTGLKFTIITIFIVGLLQACGKSTTSKSPVAMPLVIASNFPQPVYDLADNPLTDKGFELGRKLFYDPVLSRDSTVSCGSCHQQGSAFTHHGHDVSHGIDDRLGTRNAPPIMNLAWYNTFFWDGGVFNLDLQPVAPIENPVEMDNKMGEVINRLNANPVYKNLFHEAFGTETISSGYMLKALSQFMVQCVSANSKYDHYIRHENGVELTADEQEGMQLFQAKCATCHITDLFTDNTFHNNGLTPSLVNDSGRFRVTLNPDDWYKFKTPSLRNVAITAPYMHDGRFLTLDAVIDHYRKGIKDSPTLDDVLKQNGKTGIDITDDEKTKIIAFLNTLTDEDFIHDKRFSEQ